MDSGVVSNFRPQAFASRTAAERVKTGASPPGAFEISRLPVAQRPPQPKVARGRLLRRRSSPMRPGIALVAPPCIRPRSQRRLTPFFSSLLVSLDGSLEGAFQEP